MNSIQEILLPLIHIAFIILFIINAVFIVYLFITAIAGKFFVSDELDTATYKQPIAILIPAYKEDNIILDTVKKAVAHNYPTDKFKVFVAADHLSNTTIEKLQATNAVIIPVNFENSTKAKSLNLLLNTIPEREYQIAVVLDADNILSTGSLDKINAAFLKGVRGIQLHRIAKNSNNQVAIIDGITEEVNNHLFRRGQQALGFSAHTIGSGMAFELNELKRIYNKPGILNNPACDREVDFEIMKKGIQIKFLDNVYIYDEKVSTSKVFLKQRTRWLESQLYHLKLFIKEEVTTKNTEFWNKLFTVLIPPRVLFIFSFFLAGVFFLAEKVFEINLLMPAINWWLVLLLVFIITLLLSIPAKLTKYISFKTFFYLLLLSFTYLKAFFNIKRKRKEFLHTPKEYNENPENN